VGGKESISKETNEGAGEDKPCQRQRKFYCSQQESRGEFMPRVTICRKKNGI
jgi:hypothetical protein